MAPCNYDLSAAAVFKTALATARRTHKSDDYRAAAHWARQAAADATYRGKADYWSQVIELSVTADTLETLSAASFSTSNHTRKKKAPVVCPSGKHGLDCKGQRCQPCKAPVVCPSGKHGLDYQGQRCQPCKAQARVDAKPKVRTSSTLRKLKKRSE